MIIDALQKDFINDKRRNIGHWRQETHSGVVVELLNQKKQGCGANWEEKLKIKNKK